MAAKFWKDVPAPCPLYELGGTHQGHTWDRRAIKSLMKATSMRNARLTHFHCSIGLPLSLWFAESPLTFSSLFRSLNCLKFDDWRSSESLESLDDPETRPFLMAFAEGLKTAQGLHHLSLRMNDSTSNDWNIIFSGALWPKLTSLELEYLRWHADGLVSLCHSHRHTLRELSLSYTTLQISETLTSWEDVSKELGSSLRLHYIWLTDLEMQKGETIVYGKLTLQPLLQQIMQWVPSQMLEQGPDVRTNQSLWYRTKYTPRLIRGSYRSNNNGCHVCML